MNTTFYKSGLIIKLKACRREIELAAQHPHQDVGHIIVRAAFHLGSAVNVVREAWLDIDNAPLLDDLLRTLDDRLLKISNLLVEAADSRESKAVRGAVLTQAAATMNFCFECLKSHAEGR